MICSWVIDFVDPKLHTRVAYVDKAHGVWEKLRKKYTMANAAKYIN